MCASGESSRTVETFRRDVTPLVTHPAIGVLAAGVLVAMGVVAAWGPARGGLRVQPIDALRED